MHYDPTTEVLGFPNSGGVPQIPSDSNAFSKAFFGRCQGIFQWIGHFDRLILIVFSCVAIKPMKSIPAAPVRMSKKRTIGAYRKSHF
jgi:hypothetical protein